MRFSRIVLRNWRNFGSVDVVLQNRAFLVGPNASGKSNFLDVFRFLRDLVVPGGGFEKSVTARGGVSHIRNLAARLYSDVVIEVELQDDEQSVLWHYRIAFAQDRQRRPILKDESVYRDGEILLIRPDAEDEDDPERRRQTHLEQTFANREFREIADFFSSVRYFHLVPQLVRDPERSLGREADPYGGDFLEQIARTNQQIRQARLRRILAALKVAVPQLQELKLERDERGIPHLYGNYEHWSPAGAWQTETDFSDGTLRLIGLLWSLLDGGGPLLLEEPELSLHPEVVRRIPQMMWRVQQQKRAVRQVFLSTHSSDLLWDKGIAADEILLFKPSEEGSAVYVGAEIKEVKRLLEEGFAAAEVVIPHTRPANIGQLTLWEG